MYYVQVNLSFKHILLFVGEINIFVSNNEKEINDAIIIVIDTYHNHTSPNKGNYNPEIEKMS